jgi:hypothetical protein
MRTVEKQQKWWKWYGKWQMIGTDNEGEVSGDDCTEVEASAECSDMRGKLYLWISLFTMTCYRVLYYAMSTLQVRSLCVFTKGMKRWAYCRSVRLSLFSLRGSQLGLFFFKLPPFPPASPTRSVSIQVFVTDCGNGASRW